MQRTAMEKLKEWKMKRNRKPLILKGARQVGKTWLMKKFGVDCFKNVAYINFDSDVRMRQIFEEGLKPEITFKAFDLNFCDPEFADICAKEMLRLLQ